MTIVPIVTALLSMAGAVAAQNLVVDATPSHVANSFSPIRALGAGVDRMRRDSRTRCSSTRCLKIILSAGWQPVTYRQNTDLDAEAWHWNPQGTLERSLGTRLLRWQRHAHGNNSPLLGLHPASPGHEPGRDDRNYSVLTDGDPDTYWKSNPYLTRTFTGEDDSLHPQWTVVDWQRASKIDAVRIAWADRTPKNYRVQLWTGDGSPRRNATKGAWQTFPRGMVTNGHGATITLQLTSLPVPARYLRVWMNQSSNTCDTHGSSDRRNCVGYAIRELYAGTLAPDGSFQDLVKHAAGRGQSSTIVSSVDPWHQPADINKTGETR